MSNTQINVALGLLIFGLIISIYIRVTIKDKDID